jgi:hypothetical protein
VSPNAPAFNQRRAYEFPRSLRLNHWALSGDWTMRVRSHRNSGRTRTDSTATGPSLNSRVRPLMTPMSDTNEHRHHRSGLDSSELCAHVRDASGQLCDIF